MGRVNATDKMPVGDDWSGGHEVNRCRLLLLAVVAFVVALWCGLTPYGGSKQTAMAADAGQLEASSPTPSADTIREVVAGLSNEQVRELRGVLELLGKLQGELETGTTVNILT